MMMTLMFAANRTTTDSSSTSTSLQITTMEFYKIYRVSLFAGIGIKNVNIDSMFVVIDTSKCPTRQELCLWPMNLAATLLPLSKHTHGNIVQTA